MAYLLPLSAGDPETLRVLAATCADEIEAGRPVGPHETGHAYRMAAVGAGRPELVAALRSPDGRGHSEPPRVVFVFPGQGAHWPGMGRELLAANPVFAHAVRECGRAVEAELGWSPVDRLAGDGPLAAVDEVQPTVWAVQVALAAVWRDWGIEPDLVIGHSMGEIAAATVAGALTVRDGAAVVCRRGRLIAERSVPGAMWAVRLTEREATEAIGNYADRVCAGVLNSDTSTVLSGDPDALAAVTAPLHERGVFCRRVKVDYASHAPQVEPMRAGLLAALADITPRRAALPMHSTAWNRRLAGRELDAVYWADNLRRPVRFGAAVRTALATCRPTLFVEVSTHPLLLRPIEEAIVAVGAAASAVGSLVRRRADEQCLLESLGTAYVAGCAPIWSRLEPQLSLTTPAPFGS